MNYNVSDSFLIAKRREMYELENSSSFSQYDIATREVWVGEVVSTTSKLQNTQRVNNSGWKNFKPQNLNLKKNYLTCKIKSIGDMNCVSPPSMLAMFSPSCTNSSTSAPHFPIFPKPLVFFLFYATHIYSFLSSCPQKKWKLERRIVPQRRQKNERQGMYNLSSTTRIR